MHYLVISVVITLWNAFVPSECGLVSSVYDITTSYLWCAGHEAHSQRKHPDAKDPTETCFFLWACSFFCFDLAIYVALPGKERRSGDPYGNRLIQSGLCDSVECIRLALVSATRYPSHFARTLAFVSLRFLNRATMRFSPPSHARRRKCTTL